MEGGDERSQLVFVDVLELIDEERESCICVLRGDTSRLQQREEIVLEVPVVGEPRLGLVIDADLDVVVLELERLREASEPAQRTNRELLRAFLPREPEQRQAQLGRQHRRERAGFGCLDPESVDARRLRVVAHPVEQHRLAGPSEADHQDALGRPTGPDTGQRRRGPSREARRGRQAPAAASRRPERMGSLLGPWGGL